MRAARGTDLWGSTLVVVASLGLTALVAQYTSRVGLTYRELIVVGVAVCGLLTLIMGDRGQRFGLGVFVALFALGHRTFPVVGRYAIHPLLLVALALAVLVLLERRFGTNMGEPPPPIVIPRVAYVLVVFWLWGVLLGLVNGATVDNVLTHTVNLFMVVPVFIIVTGIVATERQHDLYLVLMVGAATFIALMATVEYLFPSLAARVAPGFFGAMGNIRDSSGFLRARFTSFGHQQGIFVAAMAAPFLLPLWARFRHHAARALMLGAFVVMLYGLYIAGWRSVWLQSGLLILLTATLKTRRGVGLIAVLLVGLVAYQLMPTSFRARLTSFSGLLTGQVSTLDNSARQRLIRADFSLNQVLEQPWGVGAARSGWPHNDFLLLTAETGILGGALFVGWYGARVLALWRLYWRTRRDDDLALALSMTTIGLLMLGHPLTVRDYNMMPAWFVWALVERRLWQARHDLVAPASDDSGPGQMQPQPVH